MSGNPMMEQVGRLIGGLLAGGGEVFLPGVGSLYTERRPAQRIDRRRVLPPYKAVAFASQQRGVSLVDEIVRVMRANGAEQEGLQDAAQSVYDRWIAQAREGETLRVEGVGTLKFKSFTPDEAFDLRLNPQGREPVRIRKTRRFDWACWVGVLAILVAAVFGGYEFVMLNSDERDVTPVARTSSVQQPDTLSVAGRGDAVAGTSAEEFSDASASQEGVSQAGVSPAGGAPAEAGTKTGVATESASGTATGAVAESATMKPAAASGAVGQPAGSGTAKHTVAGSMSESTAERPVRPSEAPVALISGRRYVVLGVFSTPENAERAVRDVAAKEPTFRCRIYRFGEKFMVSPFSADEAEKCTQFIRAQEERFPGMWTYTAR